MPEFKDIQAAYKRIAPHIHRTVVMTNKSINTLVGASIYFKCENLQKTGSFKIRGASNAVFSLNDDELKKGVVTHSSGNHGAALACAAGWRNIACYVVTPQNTSGFKKNAIINYGARVSYSDALLPSRIAQTEKIIKETGATLIHPYDNEKIIAGAGTSALELIDEVKELDYLFVPVGGGGSISGCAITAKNMLTGIKVIGAEPQLADDAFQSFKTGTLQPQREPRTVADGLRTALCDRTFNIVRKYVDDIVLVNDEQIIDAMRLIWERMKIVTETSSAVTLAAILNIKNDLKGKKVGAILSGGNVDLKEVLTLL